MRKIVLSFMTLAVFLALGVGAQRPNYANEVRRLEQGYWALSKEASGLISQKNSLDIALSSRCLFEEKGTVTSQEKQLAKTIMQKARELDRRFQDLPRFLPIGSPESFLSNAALAQSQLMGRLGMDSTLSKVVFGRFPCGSEIDLLWLDVLSVYRELISVWEALYFQAKTKK